MKDKNRSQTKDCMLTLSKQTSTTVHCKCRIFNEFDILHSKIRNCQWQEDRWRWRHVWERGGVKEGERLEVEGSKVVVTNTKACNDGRP